MSKFSSLLAASSLLLLAQVAHADVVINEFLYDPAGTDTNKEWIELFNDSDDPIDISGWKIQTAGTASGNLTWNVRVTIPAATTLAAKGYYLIAGSEAELGAGVDADFVGLAGNNGVLLNASNRAESVRLLDAADAVQDTVVYGTPNSLNIPNDDGVVAAANTLAQTPATNAGRTLGRSPNGVDTDNSRNDFIVTPAGQHTPGAANYEPPSGGSSSGGSSSGGSQSGSSSAGGPSSSSGGANGGSSGSFSSSGGEEETGSSSGGRRSSSSGGRARGGDEVDDDADNSALASDGGGCNAGPSAPLPLALALGALIFGKRRLARRQNQKKS